MRGECNRLQTLFLNDNPYAYYVHCFTQITSCFRCCFKRGYSNLSIFWILAFIVHVVCFSSKRCDELQVVELDEINQINGWTWKW